MKKCQACEHLDEHSDHYYCRKYFIMFREAEHMREECAHFNPLPWAATAIA